MGGVDADYAAMRVSFAGGRKEIPSLKLELAMRQRVRLVRDEL